MRLHSIPYLLPLTVLAAFAALLAHWVKNRDLDPFVPRNDNTLRRWLAADPDYLNPILRTSVNAAYVLEYVHHYLLDWDMEKNENIPRLVKGWTISEDGLDYTFPLRTDVRWHDGERFDADDVLYSFATCMNPEVPAGHARSDYMEFALTESLPADDGDGKLEAHEYLRLELSGLPSLSSAPVLDGAPEPEAAVLLSGTQTALGAAVWGDFLYLWGLQSARHDLAVFVARQPGDSVAYGPSTFVAQWDAYFLVDDGNLYPAPTGWHATGEAWIKSATFAVAPGISPPSLVNAPPSSVISTPSSVISTPSSVISTPSFVISTEGRNLPPATPCAEAMINLRELFALSPSQPLPESLYLALAILDDVQVEKLDAFTVKFHFPRKNYANLENAGYLRLVAEHYYDTGRKLTEHPKRDVPLGVGPYKFVKWDRNTSIVVERWEDYWGELAPSIQRVDFKIISDVVVAYQVFRKGDIDAMGSVGVWTYTQKSVGEQFDRHFYKLSYDRPGYEYVGYNCRRSFFSDPRCRQAMSHLIDTRAAVDNILLGLFPIVTGPYFYKEPGYDAELPRYEYNVEKAKALLDEAGWKDSDGDGVRDKDLNGDGIISDEPLDRDGNQREKFVFEYLTSDPDAQNSWVMLSFLRNGPKVGVVCRARSVEGALKLEWLRDKKWDAGGGGWVVGMESDPYTFFHSSQGADGFNFGGYASPRADRMMEAARQELDKEQRTRLFRQLHRILWEEQPYTFLIGHNWRWVLNKRVKNVRLYDLGLDFLEWELAGHESGT